MRVGSGWDHPTAADIKCRTKALLNQLTIDFPALDGAAQHQLITSPTVVSTVTIGRQSPAKIRHGKSGHLLSHPQLQVRRAALMDLGAVGWRPALGAISATLAENSLKLIALRGLVEKGPGEPDTEAVLLAMDELL